MVATNTSKAATMAGRSNENKNRDQVLYPCIVTEKQNSSVSTTDNSTPPKKQSPAKKHHPTAKEKSKNERMDIIFFLSIVSAIILYFLWWTGGKRPVTKMTSPTDSNPTTTTSAEQENTVTATITSAKEHLDHMTSRLAEEFGTGHFHWEDVSPSLTEKLSKTLGIHNYHHMHDNDDQHHHQDRMHDGDHQHPQQEVDIDEGEKDEAEFDPLAANWE